MRISVIGYGAIGRVVIQAIVSGAIESAEIAAVLVRQLDAYQPEAVKLRKSGVLFTNDVDAFFSCRTHLIVEAAGQDAVAQYGIRVLNSGSDFMVTSIGAFTDDALYETMKHCAVENKQNLYLISGALPGVDWMQGAAQATVTSVKITQNKPVTSWQGTPAETMVDLSTLTKPTCFFSGSARQAASVFQKSSNITAMLALTTLGMDRTQVSLVADPESSEMRTLIEFKGEAGELTVRWQGVPSTLNPSTSKDVPLNVVKAIRNICSPIKLGV